MDKRKYRIGIAGIQRQIKDQHEETSKKIDEAFRDLDTLMSHLNEMVKIYSDIQEYLKKDKNNDMKPDETAMLKSYLLNLGLNSDCDQLVKRNKSHGDNEYIASLAIFISKIVKPKASEKGGQLSLPEVYCMINRARGFDLISPDDLLDACKMLDERPELGLTTVHYPSGLIVLQCDDFNQSFVNGQIVSLLETMEFLTTQELALRLDISVVLARQRLLDAEESGLVCRDESIHGLRFYPNKFIQYSDDELPSGTQG